MEDVIASIDKKLENPSLIEKLAFNYTRNSGLSRQISEVVKTAGRCACLLDLYHETNDIKYLEESNKQKERLISSFPEADRQSLEELESEVVGFFKEEKDLQRKIQGKKSIGKGEVRGYILRKSSDAKVYGLILQIFTGLNVVDLLHRRQALADIEKDLEAYEEDFQTGQLNILGLELYREGYKIPSSEEAFSQSQLVRQRILSFASELVEEARNLSMDQYPILKEAITEKYQNIKSKLSEA